MAKNNKIPCTVCVLTYNSEKTLQKCLESLQRFDEIILVDGGSTDKTREIGTSYGARIVSQSNPGHPIEDFSKERNIGLKAASNYWFFYIDSDEVATPELESDIARIVAKKEPKHLMYNVQYKLTSPDYSVQYVSFKPRYQIRFFNKKSGAYFIKEVHERITFNTDQYSVGRLESSWLVPLDTQLQFSEYRKKVEHRIPKITKKWNSKNPVTFILKALFPQVISFFKQILRMLILRIREPWAKIVPLRYELYRLYTPLFMICSFTKRYVTLVLDRK